MNPEQPEYRLSDTERQQAIEALGVHLADGRLDVDEYGERSARVVAAKTRADLVPVFSDLPDPHPEVLVSKLPAASQGMRLAPVQQHSVAERLAAAAVPIAAILSLVLFMTVARGVWLVFLLPALAAVIAGAFAKRGYH